MEYLIIDFQIFLGLVFVLLANPTMAGGHAVSWEGVALTVAVVLLPSTLSATSLHFLKLRQSLNGLRMLRYSAIHLTAVVLLNQALVGIILNHSEISEDLTTQKIQYFCLQQFNLDQCVSLINRCPSCPDRIGNLNRQAIADRLKVYANPSPKQQQRQPASKK